MSVISTNLKKGTVVALKSFGEHTLTGETFIGYDGVLNFRLTNGGFTRLGNIASVVSQPVVKIPVGSVVKFTRSGSECTIESHGDDEDTYKGEIAHYTHDGGWIFPSEVEVISGPPVDEPVKSYPIKDRETLLRTYNEAAIQLAILDDRAIDFDYQGLGDSYPESRWITPIEIVGDDDSPRVVGYDRDDHDSMKSFRLDRINGRIDA